jgi:hypothetical protein
MISGMRMRTSLRCGLLLLSLAGVIVGCGGGGGGGSASTGTTTASTPAATDGPPPGWPTVLNVGPGQGPALYAAGDDGAPPFGYLSEGVRVRVNGPPVNGRLPITVGGQMVVHGWVPLSRLVAYVNQRGRIEGTPAFLGANDPVGIVSQSSDGSFRVEIRPRLGREGAADLGPFIGSVPGDWLVDHPEADGDTGLSPGEFRHLPPSTEVPVYDRPGGAVIARLPALDPPLTVVVIRSRDGWNGVRVGVGPFLIGYIQGELEESSADQLGTRPTPEATAVEAGHMPERIAVEEGALFHVQSGTWIRFYGEQVARLRAEGWAREMSRTSGSTDVDVYVAVDDGVAVRGVVPTGTLTRVTEGE